MLLCNLVHVYPLSVFATIGLVGEISGPEVVKLFSCSTQLSMKFFLLINVKMPTNVGILTFMSGKIAFCLSEPKISQIS